MFDSNQDAYVRLRNIVSERTNRLVMWVGAGLSVPAGLPDWEGLRKLLCRALKKYTEGCEESPEQEKLVRLLPGLETDQNLWVVFQRLRESLGRTSFAASIRQAFAPAASSKVPPAYKAIWKLPLSGIMTLNLDRLATRAHSECYPGKELTEFNGRSIEDYTSVLQRTSSFVVNLHGIVDVEQSWVLTHDDLAKLLKKSAYEQFIRAVFMSRNVVFMGITVDDVAVRKHIERLQGMRIEFRDHFWITNRRDSATRRWAEESGIQIVNYSATNGDHQELEELLGGLSGYLSEDEPTSPITPSRTMVSKVSLDDADLASVDEEGLRQALNARAKEILEPGDQEAHRKYAEFLKDYAHEIYRCWYVTTQAPRNVLLGYELVEEIGKGAFGRIFLAKSKEHEGNVVVKLLRHEIMEMPEVMHCFRRGVRSMRILSERRIEGMVPYLEASELPAIAVMNYVDGPNLQQAMESRFVGDWSTRLRIGLDLACILRRAHQLPERVLHRDLRPENIMLRGYWAEPDDWQVVLLDFDLSWHVGAEEKSVTFGAESRYGFLAPEQLDRQKNISTRNAAVDSYGLGMVLFFLLSGRAPQYMEHKHSDWTAGLRELDRSNPCKQWLSLPRRFTRLIDCATQHNQKDRWDMSQIEGELIRLRQIELNSTGLGMADILCEELAARFAKKAKGELDYEWDQDRSQATIKFVSGTTMSIRGDETAKCLVLAVAWTSSGDQRYGAVKKYLKPAVDKTIASMGRIGWKCQANPTYRSDNVHFEMSSSLQSVASRMDETASSLCQAADDFSFS